MCTNLFNTANLCFCSKFFKVPPINRLNLVEEERSFCFFYFFHSLLTSRVGLKERKTGMIQDSVRKPVIHWFHVLLYLLDLRAGCGIRIGIINTAVLSIHPGNVPEPSCRVVG